MSSWASNLGLWRIAALRSRRTRRQPLGFPAVPHADAVGATQDENEVTWNAALHTG